MDILTNPIDAYLWGVPLHLGDLLAALIPVGLLIYARWEKRKSRLADKDKQA